IWAAVDRLFEAKDIDGLEATTVELFARPSSYPDGFTGFDQFFARIGTQPGNPPDSTIRDRIATIEEWARRKPRSAAARVALAEIWVAYAWRARGSGWASEVTEEGWRLFRERLAKAHEAMDEARQLGDPPPRWWAAAQRIDLGENWDDAISAAT